MQSIYYNKIYKAKIIHAKISVQGDFMWFRMHFVRRRNKFEIFILPKLLLSNKKEEHRMLNITC